METKTKQDILLPKLDVHRRAFRSFRDFTAPDSDDLKPHALALAHTILCMQKPDEKSPFAGLANFNGGVFSENLGSEFNKLLDEAQSYTESYESFEKFVAEKQEKLALWFATTAMTVKEDPGRALKMATIIKTLRAGLGQLDADGKLPNTIATPRQILLHLIPMCKDYDSVLHSVSKGLKGSSKAIGKIRTALKDLATSMENGLASNDVLLLTVTHESFLATRTLVAEFALFISFIQPLVEGVSLNGPIAEIWYYLDVLMGYRVATAQLPTTPFDVTVAAQNLLKIVKDASEMKDNTAVVGITNPLDALEKFLEDLIEGYACETALMPVTQRTVDGICESIQVFENMMRALASASAGIGHKFITSFYQLFVSLLKLEFRNDKSIFDPWVVISNKSTVDSLIGKTSEQVKAQQITEDLPVTFVEVMPLFVNPSRKGRGVLGYTESGELQALGPSLVSHKEEAAGINVNSITLMPTIKKLAKEIAMLGYVVDKFLPSDELIESYHECVKTLNAKLVEIIEKRCIKVTSYPPRAALKLSIWMMNYLIADYDKAGHAADQAIVEECKHRSAVIGEMAERYTKIDENYSESLLVKAKDKIAADIETIKEFMKDAKRFDHAARDCYLRNIAKFFLPILDALRDFVAKMPEQAFSLNDAINDLNNAGVMIYSICERLTFVRTDYESRLVALALTNIVKSVSGVRLALLTAKVRKVVPRLIELRNHLDALPELVRIVASGIDTLEVLEPISMARWRLSHLEEYYQYDKQLLPILESTYEILDKAQQSITIETTKTTYEKVITELHSILIVLGGKSERTGDEPTEYVQKFQSMIRDISMTFDPSATPAEVMADLEKSRADLNQAITILHGQPVSLTNFVDVAEQYKGTILERYVGVAVQHAEDKDRFYEEAKRATNIDLPRDLDKLKEAERLLNNFISSSEMDVMQIQARISTPILWYLTAAKYTIYNQKDRFLECAIELQRSDPDNLGELCFELSYHFHKIYEKAHTASIKDKSAIEALLVKWYMQRSNLTLADVVYYTTVYMTLIPEKDRPIFGAILQPFKDCFHCREQVFTVDCSDAIKYLKGEVPDEIRLRKIATMAKELEERRGVSVQLRAYKQDELEPLEIQERGVGIVLDSETKKPLTFKEKTMNVTVNTSPKASPAWKPYMTSKVVKKVVVEKTVIRQEAWLLKSTVECGIKYGFAKVGKPEVPFHNDALVNEYHLPSDDKRKPESVLNDITIHSIQRAISYHNKDADLKFLELCQTFKSLYKPKKVQDLPTKFSVEKFEAHQVFEQLKASAVGDVVPPINVSAASKEELLHSFIPAVSRFIEIASPVNIDAFTDFLAYFDRGEIETLLSSWLILGFDPRSYGQKLLIRYLKGVATFVRAVVEGMDGARLITLLKCLDEVIRVASIIVLTKAAKKKGKSCVLATKERAEAVADFCNAVSVAIGALSRYKAVKRINLEFVNFLEIIAPYSDLKCFCDCFEGYIDTVGKTVPLEFNTTEPVIEKPHAGLRLVLLALRAFSDNPSFIIHVAIQKYPLLDTLCEVYTSVFDKQDEALIRKYIITFSEFARFIESIGQYVEDVATTLLPLLKTAAKVHTHEIFKKDYIATQHFIIPLLLVIHHANHKALIAYTKGLAEYEQVGIYEAFSSLIENLLTTKDIPSPMIGFPEAKDRDEELQMITSLTKTIDEQLNYTLFKETTMRLVKFLSWAAYEVQFDTNVAVALAKLIVTLLNRHQDKSYYSFVLLTVTKLFDGNNRAVFKGDAAVLDTFGAAAFELLTRQLQVARCSGVVLIVHLLYYNFYWCEQTTASMLILSKHFNDAIVSAKDYKFPTFAPLLTRLLQFLRVFSRERFTEQAMKDYKRLCEVYNQAKDKRQ